MAALNAQTCCIKLMHTLAPLQKMTSGPLSCFAHLGLHAYFPMAAVDITYLYIEPQHLLGDYTVYNIS